MPKVNFTINYTQEDAERYRKLAQQFQRKCELMEARLEAYQQKVTDLRTANAKLKEELRKR